MIKDTGQYSYVEEVAVRDSVFMNEYNKNEAGNISLESKSSYRSYKPQSK